MAAATFRTKSILLDALPQTPITAPWMGNFLTNALAFVVCQKNPIADPLTSIGRSLSKTVSKVG